MNEPAQSAILRERQVYNLTNISTTTRWRMEKAGTFPKRRRLSPGTTGWLASEIQQWIASRKIISL